MAGRITERYEVDHFLAHLYSYDTGGAHLERAHREYLDRLADRIPDGSTVRVVGVASRLGSERGNRRLSRQRAEVVVRHLESLGTGATISAAWVGEEVSLTGAEDDARHRAVLIFVYPPRGEVPVTPPPELPMPQPVPRPPEAGPTDRFYVRLIGGAGAGEVAVGGVYLFEIGDINGNKQKYTLMAGGIGWGAPAGVVDEAGPPNWFTLDTLCTVRGFVGQARLSGVTVSFPSIPDRPPRRREGIPFTSVGRAIFSFVDCDGNTHRFNDFKTGRALAAEISAVQGPFTTIGQPYR